MRIDSELKLGFKDVLIRPKRSTLKSRSQVDLKRTLFMKHTQYEWEGIPIIAANMDSVGTFQMAKVLQGFEILTAIHKHYNLKAWKNFLQSNPAAHNMYLLRASVTSNFHLSSSIGIDSLLAKA